MLPNAFVNGKTPEAWCALLQEKHGIKLSVRTLRSFARDTGNLQPLGRDMLLLPEHIENILEEMKCRLKSIKEGKLGGSEGGSSNFLTVNTSDKALAKLRKQARRP
jgi:hypothetical protein